MTMDADECHSGLNLASRGAIPKLAVRQLGRLISIYMSSPPAAGYLLWRGYRRSALFTYDVEVCIKTIRGGFDGCYREPISSANHVINTRPPPALKQYGQIMTAIKKLSIVTAQISTASF